MKPLEVVLKRLQNLEYKIKKLEREVENLKKENTTLNAELDTIKKPAEGTPCKKETDEISAGWFWQ